MLKKDKLRYNEYFDMQSIFDELYQQSRNNNNFYKLMEVIGSKQNIRLAYRNLKGNTGSKTKGTDGKTIEDISKLNDEMLIKEVRARLEDYNPLPVRRVYIPKPGSDKKETSWHTDYMGQTDSTMYFAGARTHMRAEISQSFLWIQTKQKYPPRSQQNGKPYQFRQTLLLCGY